MRTEQLLTLAAAHMTHNYAPPRFVVARGEGARLWDMDGKVYLDFAGGIGVNALGHAHPEVVMAISEQAARYCHTGNVLYHPGYIEMCARLAQLSFGDRVFLSNSGTESAEAALKLARRYFFDRGERRTELVATEGAFHGRTMGAVSVTGQPEYRTGFEPLIPDVKHAPFGDLDAMRAIVGPHTAAVILEPIQGNAGVVLPPPGYLRGLRALCDQAGCLLIFDEVQTGVGRTGRWFAYEHEGVTPDMMTLAKGLGGGLPLGAVVMTQEVAGCLKPGVHASTFGGNPVACAAGLATLSVIERDGLLQRAERLGESYRTELGALGERHGCVREVRGRGLLVGLVLDGPAKGVIASCRERGLLCTAAGSDVLRLFPPLNVQDEDLAQSLETIDSALAASR